MCVPCRTEECIRVGAGFCLFLRKGCIKKVLSLVCESLFAFQNARVGKLNFDYLEASKDSMHLKHNSR